jgi:Flp pilus assembly protein CpaB
LLTLHDEFWQRAGTVAEVQARGDVKGLPMNKKENWWALAAFLVGLLGIHVYSKRLKEQVQGGELAAVLVVNEDLKSGAVISSENLGEVWVPAGYLDERRIRASERSNLVGAQLQEPLRAGGALLWSDLVEGVAQQHLATLLQPGRRAYSLRADANPLGSLLHVADRVDVLVESNGESSTLMSQVLVLAVGGNTRKDERETLPGQGSGGGVALSVTPEQAGELLSAEAHGKLRLVLRNPDDFAAVQRTTPKESASRPPSALSASQPREVNIDHVR